MKDLNQLDIDESVNPESPMGLLRGIKYGTESYHDLFKRLCRFVNASFVTVLEIRLLFQHNSWIN